MWTFFTATAEGRSLKIRGLLNMARSVFVVAALLLKFWPINSSISSTLQGEFGSFFGCQKMGYQTDKAIFPDLLNVLGVISGLCVISNYKLYFIFWLNTTTHGSLTLWYFTVCLRCSWWNEEEKLLKKRVRSLQWNEAKSQSNKKG